jgi:hypothetical protein
MGNRSQGSVFDCDRALLIKKYCPQRNQRPIALKLLVMWSGLFMCHGRHAGGVSGSVTLSALNSSISLSTGGSPAHEHHDLSNVK